jgi:hypothetical protein
VVSEPSFVPDRAHADVPLAKVARYLLNPSHPEGAPKAAFFMAFGFAATDPQALVEALLAHVQEHPASESRPVHFGTMYTVVGPLQCRDGRTPLVRSVWIIEPPVRHPRLVTAYPANRANRAAP